MTVEPKSDESEFHTRVAEFNETVRETTWILSSVSVAQLAFWGDLEGSAQADISEMIVQHGFDWLEEVSGITHNDVQVVFNRLYAAYTELQNISVADEEEKEIQNEVSVLFAYFSMVYQTVTEPGDSFENFTLNMSISLGGAMASDERLDELLGRQHQ